MKLALSDVNPALSASLPTNSSAVLSDTLVAFLQVLAIGAFDDGPSFLRLFVALPSLKLSYCAHYRSAYIYTYIGGSRNISPHN